MMEIPKTAVKIGCPFCMNTNKFDMYGTIKGTRRILYFKCSDCGKVTRIKTKE